MSPICVHGVDLETARCCQCDDPAFHAAQQPAVTVRAATVGGATLSSNPKNCPHPTLYARDMFMQPQAWDSCLLCERDYWKAAYSKAASELEQMREDWKTICEAADAMPAPAKEQSFREALARIAAGFYTEAGAERHAKDVLRLVDSSPETTAEHCCVLCKEGIAAQNFPVCETCLNHRESVPHTEFAWLIELQDGHLYFAPGYREPEQFDWASADPNHAVRFARKEDAERVIANLLRFNTTYFEGDTWIAREHGWCQLPEKSDLREMHERRAAEKGWPLPEKSGDDSNG